MQPIPIANKKEFKQESPEKGKFIIEPFYPGYGLTVGNALRRVLLSSMEGVAITAVKIAGAEHEFSALEGVKEDVVDIILNLKQVSFELENENDEPIKLEISAKGAKTITAGVFSKVTGVKVSNPKTEIVTLTDSKSEFHLEAWIDRGRGYLPTEAVEGQEKESGVITIDAIFSPIKKVSIDTENVRVGDMTNWDRLILDVETDGSIDIEEALKKSANILIQQFGFLVEENSAPAKEEVKEDVEEEKEEETEE